MSDLEVLAERNVHEVPLEAIHRMWDRWESDHHALVIPCNIRQSVDEPEDPDFEGLPPVLPLARAHSHHSQIEEPMSETSLDELPSESRKLLFLHPQYLGDLYS